MAYAPARLLWPSNPPEASWIVDVMPAPVERELRGVLVRARNLGSGLAALASNVHSTLRGAADSTANFGIHIAVSAKNIIVQIPQAEQQRPDSFISRVQRVEIPQLGLSTLVDKTGRFVLSGVPAGTHQVHVAGLHDRHVAERVAVLDPPGDGVRHHLHVAMAMLREAAARRWGVETDIENVVLCGSGARRGGAVSGIGGHNAAQAVIEARAAR